MALFAVGLVFGRFVSPFLEPWHHTPSVILLSGWGVAAIRVRDARMFLAVALAWFLGAAHLPIAEVVGGRWPALMLIASDLVLLAVAFVWPDIDRESPEPPGPAPVPTRHSGTSA